MVEESLPPSPNRALVPLAPEWQPILHASNQVVLYNPTSHALSIHHKSPNASVHVPHRSSSPCPFCHRPLPPGFGRGRGQDDDDDDDDGAVDVDDDMGIDVRRRHELGSHSRASNYFQLLAIANESSRPSSPPPLANGNAHGSGRPSTFPREAMAEGYFKAFFQEEYRLGMGANGSVYLCQHVLDENPLGRFAVKKIAVGESHSYLLSTLREIRLLETLHHRNIITYHHAWLETCQFSAFGPKVPTLHVLMQWAEGGSLDDLIDTRLGRPSKLPHMRSSPESPAGVQSPSARIRAFREMRRAPPEERERLRREMAENSGIRIAGRPSMKAVHLFSAEEVKSLFSDVVEGLAFLHDRSILHLDLKPGNVLLTWDEGRPRAMLSDFGTSRDMIHSSGSRSGNTGTLEYAAPESLPSPQTGLLREADSKSDMWSLGMILHKMLFFRLPYRYATEGEASAGDEADKMDKLEQEISRYPGFRSTPALRAAFESRHLPAQAFMILLEGLLSVNPSVRPTSERIVSAIREGKFNPVATTPGASWGSLIPVRWSTDESRRDVSTNGPRALPPVPTTEGRLDEDQSWSERKEEGARPHDATHQTRSPSVWDVDVQGTFIRSVKACILAAKAVSIALCWEQVRERPIVLSVLGIAALADTISERFEVSMGLGVFHVLLMYKVV